MSGLQFDIAHLLAGGLVLISLMMLYQDRLTALINVFAAQALTLSLAVGWQAYIQAAPHLYITAAIALPFAYTASRSAAFNRRLAFASSILSVAFGLFLIYHIGFVQGLFTK